MICKVDTYNYHNHKSNHWAKNVFLASHIFDTARKKSKGFLLLLLVSLKVLQ